jgi:hypothetical protein
MNTIEIYTKYAVFITDLYVNANLMFSDDSEENIEDGQNTNYFLGGYGDDDTTPEEAIQEAIDDLGLDLNEEQLEELKENMAVLVLR